MNAVKNFGPKELRQIVLSQLHGLAPEADLSTLRPHDDLRETLEIDSFDFLNFLIALDQEVGVEIPEKDYGKVGTLAGLMDYLLVRLPEAT
ncbi:MAG: acyl carrier protein [Chloroflexi bacterium]|nr:acyl carrier protein [Chloroflexota bacterium]